MKPMDRQIVPTPSRVQISDYSRPEIAGANAARGYAEVAQFMEDVMGVAKPIYEEWQNSVIKGELEQIASDPNFSFDKYRDQDENTQAFLRSFNPRTRQIVEENWAAAASTDFANQLTVAGANSKILGNPSSSDTQLGEERAKIIEQATQATGLDRIPASALRGQLPNIELAKAGMRSKAQERRVKEQDVRNTNLIQSGWSSAFLDGLDFQTGFDVGTAELTPEQQRVQQEAALTRNSQAWLTRLDGLSETYNPTDVGKTFYQGLMQAASGLIVEGEFDKAEALLQQASTVADQYKFDNGGALGSVSVGKNGGTVNQLINAQLLKLQGKEDKRQTAQFLKDNATLIETAGNPALPASVRQNARQAFLLAAQGNPQAAVKALQIADQMSELQKPQLTPDQELQYRDLLFSTSDTTTPRSQRELAIINSGLPPAWQTDLAKRLAGAGETTNDPIGRAVTARRNSAAEIIDSVGRIQRAKAAAVSALGANNVAPVPGTEELENELRVEASEATTKRITAEQAETGKIVEQDRANVIFREELTKAEESTLKKYNLFTENRDLSPGSFLEQQTNRAMQDLGYVARQVREGYGKGDLELFPPDFISGLAPQKRNYADALKAFQNRFVNIRNAEGRSVFPDFSQRWQKVLKGGTGLEPTTPPDTRPGGFIIPKALFGPAPGEETKDGEKGDQASVSQQLEGALGQLLNVVIPAAPANAESLDGKTDSDYSGMQTAEMLSAAMRRPGSVDLGPSTPVLPQQGAAAVTARPIPTQINSPNHPYFVAIGLNEGTRTPDGGYTRAYYGHTDPGDGAANRGTISARAGSPQQADRQWASILSGRAIEARAFLRKAGLADNTVGFQRVMFNVLDLMVQVGQYSGANDDFLGKLPDMQAAGFTIESVAKARTDSYINPSTGRLEAAGFGNSYNRLFQDQRRRAGTFDYKKRL